MPNDNHPRPITCYNVTIQEQDYYMGFFELGQQKINFKFYELSLPDDDPALTLKKVMKWILQLCWHSILIRGNAGLIKS